MKKFYEKSEITFSIILIAAYCVLMSVGDSLSAKAGVVNAVTLPVGALLSVFLIAFIKRNSLFIKYGLCKSEIKVKKVLYYIPLLILLTSNLWFGADFSLSATDVVLHILTMFCVGFLEEIIFRGFLFKALLKEGEKTAIVISSVTFGMGHIIRMFNGSDAELFENLLQVIYAIAAGFMFTMLFYRTKSLVVCIITHGVFNALSIFQSKAALTEDAMIFSCILLVIISAGYALYLYFGIRHETKEQIKNSYL